MSRVLSPRFCLFRGGKPLLTNARDRTFRRLGLRRQDTGWALGSPSSCSTTERQPPQPVVARVAPRPSSSDWQARIRPALTPAQAQTRSEEPTAELQSLMHTSYAVLCLTKNKDTLNL